MLFVLRLSYDLINVTQIIIVVMAYHRLRAKYTL